MPDPLFLAGNLAKIGVNGQNIDGQKGWSVDVTGEEKRTDNTRDNGYARRLVAMRDLVATIEGDLDGAQNLLEAPINFYIGMELSNVKLYRNGTTSPFWSLPKAIVLKVNEQAPVGDTVKFSITIANQGPFSKPTGTFVPVTPGT